MKKHLYLKSILLALACLLGVGNSWADTTIVWTVSGVSPTVSSGSKITGSTLSTSSVKKDGTATNNAGTWKAVTTTASYAANNSGAQFGSGSQTFAGTITLTAGSDIPNTATIKSIVLNATTNGSSYKVAATVGGNTFGSTATLKSSNEDPNYTFSGSQVGNNIVLTFSDGGKKNVIIKSITVTYSTSSDPTISLKPTSTTIEADASETLTATTTNASGATINWTTSDDTKVSLGSTTGASCKITGLLPTATPVNVTAKITVGGKDYSATCAVTVTAKADEITLDDSDMELTVGGAAQKRTATASSGRTLSYTSNDPTVATVDDDGTVHPVGEGTCTITASVAASGKWAAAEKPYTVNVTDPNKGIINFNSSGGAGCMSILADKETSTGTDTNGNMWYVTPVWEESSNTSCSNSTTKVQVGSDKKPITSVTFTMTLPGSRLVKSMKCMFSAFNKETIKISMKVGDTEIGTGSITNAGATEISSTGIATGNVLTVTVTGRRVDCYYITYTIDAGSVTPLTPSDLTVTSPLAVTAGETASISYSTSSMGAMTFISDNTDIATVDEAGKVTGVAEGTTTISVSQAADATYAASETKKVTVNVSAAPAADGDYIKVTSTPASWEGTYLIVYESSSTEGLAMDGSLTTLDASGNSIEVDIVGGNKIAASATNDASSFNISSDGDEGWIIRSRSGKYIGSTSNKDSGGDFAEDESTAYTNSLSVSGGVATIHSTNRDLKYNKSKGQTRFRYYLSGQEDIALYKRKVALSASAVTTTASFNPSSKTLNPGQTFTNTLTTNNTNGTKTYSSDDESVATVDEASGLVTAVGVGTTRIRVAIGASATHTSGEASYEIVVEAAVSSGYYVKVTSSPGDWSGTYLIVYEGSSLAMNGSLETLDATSNGLSVTISEDKIPVTTETNAASFSIAKVDSRYTIKNQGGYYIGNLNASNGLKASSSEAYENVISLNDDGDVEIKAINSSDEEGLHLRFNKTSGQERFRYYNSDQEKIYLYRKTTEGTLTTATASFSDATHTMKVGETWTNSLATNSNATPVYSTPDGNIISVNPTTGEVTALAVGEATVNCTVPANEFYTTATASYTVTVNKGDNDLTLTSLATVAMNLATLTRSTITYETSSKGALTWNSSNPTVATITQGSKETGVITANAVGETDITFSQAEDANYLASSTITVHVTVTAEAVATGTIYSKVASTDQLVAGKHYLLVWENNASSKAMGTVDSASGASVDVVVSDKKITITDEAVNVLTLGGEENAWTFRTSLGGKYLEYYKSAFQEYTYASSDAAKWTVEYSEEDVTITNNASTTYEIQYNNGNSIFACYAGTQYQIALYVEEDAVSAAGYYYRVSGSEENVPEGDYLIVYEGLKRALDGYTEPESAYNSKYSQSILKGPYVDVTIVGDRIPASTRLDNAMYHISGTGSACLVMSNYRKKYIGDNDLNENISNGMRETSTANTFYNTASIQNGDFILMGGGDAPGVGGITVHRYLRYNWQESFGDAKMFRFYRDDSGVQTKIALYRRINADQKYVQFLPHGKEMSVGDTWETNLVTQNTTGTPVYTSMNPQIATVDANGVVTAVSPGKVDIKVTVDGVSNFANVVVLNANALSRYVRVDATGDLTSGDYLIVYQSSINATSGVAMDGSFTPENRNEGTQEADPVSGFDVVIEADKEYPSKRAIGATTDVDAKAFSVIQTYDSNTSSLIHQIQSKSGWYFTKQTAADGFQTNVGAFNNTLTATSSNATFKGIGDSYLKYNASTGKFYFYANGQNEIQLYKKEAYNYDVYAGNETPINSPIADVDGPIVMGRNSIAYYDISSEVAADPILMENIADVTNVVVNGSAYHLKLSDKTDGVDTYTNFYAPASFTTTQRVSYARPNAGGWNSVCLPFSIPFEKVEELFGTGAKVYQLTALNAEHNVVFTELTEGTVPAGEPVLVYSEDTEWNAASVAGTFDVKANVAGSKTVGNTATTGTAEIVGTYSTILPVKSDGATYYKLKADGSSFGTMSTTARVFPFRMYIKYTPPKASSSPAQLPVKLHVIEGVRGDLNRDKMATLSDLTLMINMRNGLVKKTASADLNGDDEVDETDINGLVEILKRKK